MAFVEGSRDLELDGSHPFLQKSRVDGTRTRLKSPSFLSSLRHEETLKARTGVPSHASSGLTTAQFLSDVNTARQSINEGVDSKLFLILPAKTYGAVSLLRDGSPLVVGGMLGDDIRVIRSGAATTSAVLVDASAVACGSGTPAVVLDRATQDIVELNDNPTSGDPVSAQYFSLWQNQCQCLRVERYFGAQLMRTDGAAVISGYSD